MRPTIRIFITLAIALVALPAFGLKLIPGTYKLKWETRQKANDSLWLNHAGGYDSFSEPDLLTVPRDGIKGAVSKRAWVTTSSDYRIVLDESKGTGKGYDTAYIMPSSGDTEIRLKRMIQVPLKRQGSFFVAKAFPISIQMGSIRRQRVFDLRIQMQRRCDSTPHAKTRLYVTGGWYGSIKTDQGVIQMRLLERGSFGNWSALVIGKPHGSVRTVEGLKRAVTIEPDSPIVFDNQLYCIHISCSGDTVKVEPYKGPTGTVTVSAVNGFGKPIYKYQLCLDRASGHSLNFNLREKQTIRVPAGEYNYAVADFSLNSNNYPGMRSRLPGLSVKRDKVTNLSLGGPVTIKMGIWKSDDGSYSITSKWLLPKPQECDSILDGSDIYLVLKDSSGKTVFSKHANDHFSTDPDYFQLPTKLEPGSYVAILTVDLKPYDKKKIFGARVQIE